MSCCNRIKLGVGEVDVVEKEYKDVFFGKDGPFPARSIATVLFYVCINSHEIGVWIWPQRGISVFDFGWSWDIPNRSNILRLNSPRLSYDEAEIVQNALYAQNIEVPVKALSGKLYVRHLISKT